jgi:hypothetical protein
MAAALCLDGVHAEDRPVIGNVVAALDAIKAAKAESLFTSWTCHVETGCYVVTAFLSDADCDFSARELELVHDVSPLRVLGVAVHRAGGKLSLRVRVSDRDAPIMLTDAHVVRVRKRVWWAR